MSSENERESLKPGLAVGVLVFNNRNEVLLGQRHSRIGDKTWALPGGKVEKGETVMEAAKRELLEEVGMIAEKTRFISVAFETFYGLDYMTFGVVATAKGKPQEKEKAIGSWKWFPLINLNISLFAPSERIIRNYLAGKFRSRAPLSSI